MAEPARKFDYKPKPQDNKPSWTPRVIQGGSEGGGETESKRPDLRVLEGGSENQTSAIETPAQEEKRRGNLRLVHNAEAGAKAPGQKTDDVAKQESGINMPSAQDLYKKSAETRAKGGKRGIFIGLGAGGGLLSVVAGFSFLLPFKLIGIMDGVIDSGGQRLENMVEKRAEKFLVQYFIRGSTAAVGTGDFINTGNPLGDIFANIRTSNFEKTIYQKYGWKFERGDNGALKLVYGNESAQFKSAEEFAKYLDRDDLTTKDIRKVMKLMVKQEIPAWRFFKRAKFIKWLRLKYKIPRFGTEKQKDGQSEADYEKSVEQAVVSEISEAEVENVGDIVQCISSGGDDCAGVDGDTTDIETEGGGDKAGGGQELQKNAEQAVQDTVSAVGSTDAAEVSKTLVQRMVSSIIGDAAGDAVPYVGQVDFLVRILHTIQSGTKNSSLQKMHASYMKRLYVVFFATMAGMADQTKAGDMSLGATGMLADQYTGMEGSQSWNYIQSGKATGQGLSTMEKIGENLETPEWLKTVATVSEYAAFPVTIWYNTISKGIDLLGGLTSDILGKIPGVAGAKAAMGKVIGNFIVDLLTMIGMGINPQVTGELRHLYTYSGGVAAFDDNCKDMGCRKLTHAQAVGVDNDIKQEKQTELADEPFMDRIFNINNSESLASTIVAALPVPSQSDPLGSIAFAGADMVGRAPTDLANIITPSASAADTTIPEDIAGSDAYGGTGQDTSATFTTDYSNCPTTTDGSTYNTCMIDKNVAESVNCAVAKCDDLNVTDDDTSGSTFDTFADLGAPLPTPATPEQTQALATAEQTGGTLAALVPFAALEISRRKI